MDAQDRATVAARLAEVRDAYLARLPAELDTLQDIAAALCGGEGDRAQLEELRHRLHKLAGSGGTFGLNGLSAAARRLENRIKQWLNGPFDALQDTEVRQALVADLAALSASIGDGDHSLSQAWDASPGQAAGEGVEVWLIEDDVPLGQELVRQLGAFGFRVRLFARLAEFEHAAQTERPDVLLVDVMFEGEGKNATEFLASWPPLRALQCPLYFISAHDDFLSRVRAARLGAQGYFLKPLDVPGLVIRISRALEQKYAPVARVLIVDDDRQLAEHYRLVLLAAGIEAEVLQRPTAIMETLEVFRPELVLMDMHMPDFSGPDLTGVIRQYEKWAGLPIVYLSAETDFDQQIRAMGRGADDFLVKPLSDAQLVAAVRVRVERARQLAEQISRDSLTGLLRHASIKEMAAIEVSRAHRLGSPVTVAMLDIDHFKAVNDKYGHAAGDLVISALAMLLRQRLRRSDIIGRYGGEEFAAVLPACDAAQARRLMEDIRQRFAMLRFGHAGRIFSCTISVGLACSEAYPESDGIMLLAAADAALYVAKRSGRNQVQEVRQV